MSRVASWWIAIVAVTVAVYVVTTTTLGVIQHQQPMPCQDQWETIRQARMWDEGRFGWRQLVMVHNEHRLAVPRLLFAIDDRLFAQRGQFLVAASLTVQALHLVLLALLIRGAGVRSGPGLVACTAVLSTYLFAGTQLTNFSEPFQVQFVLVFLAATAAFAALARVPASRRPHVWSAAAVALGVVSSFTMANGLLVWPLLLALGYWLRLGWRVMVAPLLGAALVIAVYLVDYQSPGHHSDPLTALWRPLDVALYVARYLSAPIRLPDFEPLLVVGPLFVLPVLPLLWAAVRRCWPRVPGADRAHQLALLGVACFTFGTAVMTGLGRLNLPPEQAASARYTTTSLLFWAALLALSLTVVGPRLRRLGCALCAVVLLAVVWQQPGALHSDWWARREIRTQGLALEAGVQDFRGLANFGHPRDVWTNLAGYMAERGLSVFHARRGQFLGGRVADLFGTASTARCMGAIDSIRPVADSGWAFVADGWVWIEGAMAPPTDIYFVDERGVILGLADFHSERPDVAVDHPVTAKHRVGFRGYGSASSTRTVVRVFARSRDGAVHESRFSAAFDAELTNVGPAVVPRVTRRLVGDFAPVEPPSGGTPANLDEVVACAGTGVGEVHFGPVQGIERLAVPLCTGAVPFGADVALVDPADGTVVRQLWPPATYSEWRFWCVDIPASLRDRPLEVVVKDTGTSPNQSLRTAPPMLVAPDDTRASPVK